MEKFLLLCGYSEGAVGGDTSTGKGALISSHPATDPLSPPLTCSCPRAVFLQSIRGNHQKDASPHQDLGEKKKISDRK